MLPKLVGASPPTGYAGASAVASRPLATIPTARAAPTIASDTPPATTTRSGRCGCALVRRGTVRLIRRLVNSLCCTPRAAPDAVPRSGGGDISHLCAGEIFHPPVYWRVTLAGPTLEAPIGRGGGWEEVPMHLLRFNESKLARTARANRQEIVRAGLSRRDMVRLGLL